MKVGPSAGGVAMAAIVALCAIAASMSAAAQEGSPPPPGGAPPAQTITRPVQAEILVVLAREQEGEVDPELADLPALRQPPFNAYRSMDLLFRVQRQLSPDAPLDYVLVNGRRLRIELERTTTDGRYRVRVSINRPGESDYLPLLHIVASPGDPFFVAGQNWQGGTLVIGLRIGERAAARKAA